MSEQLSNFVFHVTRASKAYNGIPALQNASLRLSGGEVHGLIGENGAGKSTFIKLLSGTVTADTMQITRNDQPKALLSPEDAYALGLRFVHQEHNLVPSLSVAENIFLSHPYPRRFGIFVNWQHIHHLAHDILYQLGIEHINVQRPMHTLGSGDAMLVKIASAFAGTDLQNINHERIYILDEPTASLMQYEIDILFGVIRTLRQQGAAILYVTHRLSELFEIGDKVTVLRDGQVVANHQLTSVDTDDLIRDMTGRSVQNIYPERDGTVQATPVIQLDNVTNQHIHHINLNIHEGEIVGIAGLVGSGRSELLQTIIGAEPSTEGTLMLNGKPLNMRGVTNAWRQGIAYVPEERRTQGLVLSNSIKDNVTLPHLAKLSTASSFVQTNQEHQLTRELGDEVRLKARATHQPVKELSGGNQQKVLFARAMLGNPSVLLLDEPTRGVDVGAKYDIYKLIHQLADDGVGVLMVSSDLGELIGMCSRVYIMSGGHIVDHVTTESMTEEALLNLCYGIGARN